MRARPLVSSYVAWGRSEACTRHCVGGTAMEWGREKQGSKHEAPAWSASRLWLVACCAFGGVLP